MLASRYTSHH